MGFREPGSAANRNTPQPFGVEERSARQAKAKRQAKDDASVHGAGGRTRVLARDPMAAQPWAQAQAQNVEWEEGRREHGGRRAAAEEQVVAALATGGQDRVEVDLVEGAGVDQKKDELEFEPSRTKPRSICTCGCPTRMSPVNGNGHMSMIQCPLSYVIGHMSMVTGQWS